MAHHGVGPFGHGSQVQQPETLDHHGHRQAECRRVTNRTITWLPAIGSPQAMRRRLFRWRERLPECIGRNHHLVKVVALGTLKCADIETDTCRHDPSEHHVAASDAEGSVLIC